MSNLKLAVLGLLLLGHTAHSKPTSEAENRDGCGECCTKNFETCPFEQGSTDDRKWVVCHYTSWSHLRKEPATFSPQDVDPSLCTHINYAFAVLDPTSLTITASNRELDERQHFYLQITGFKSQGLTVMLSIGGAVDSGDGDKWSRMIRSDNARAWFVATTVTFLEKFNFDGLDMGFSFPACPKGKRAAGKESDKEKYNQLLRELRGAFKGRFFLSVQAAAKKEDIDECYDMPEVTKLVDWVNLMSYEYHRNSEPKTGAQAPICGNPASFGVYDTVKYYLDVVRCPAEKLVLGIPFFAGSYTLQDGARPRFGEPTAGPGPRGPYLNMQGYLSYFEVCQFANTGWNKGLSQINGDYIWKDKVFVTTPSVADINRKSCLIKYFNLKGANLWTMDYDDFNNVCGCGKYPLLKTLNKHLRGLDTDITCY